jgi:chromosome segregation ATPase
MNWRKILTISAVIAAGILVYTVYLYLGPYRKVSKEKQQLKEEIEARMASESKMGEELGTAKAELAEKIRLVEDLQTEIAELTETISQTKGARELFQELKQVKGEYQHLEQEAGQLRKTIAALEADKKALDEETSGLKKELQESSNRLRMLSQEVAAKE